MSGNHDQLEIDTDYLRSLLSYDSASGVLRWNVSRGSVKAGAIAGCMDRNGYWVVRIDRKNFLSHRIAWQLHFSAPPPRYIDHINGDTSDFRIENLRAATASQNVANSRRQLNTRSGIKGVGPSSKCSSWHAQIVHQGRKYWLGSFKTKEAAAAAYSAKAVELFGEFANSGEAA